MADYIICPYNNLPPFFPPPCSGLWLAFICLPYWCWTWLCDLLWPRECEWTCCKQRLLICLCAVACPLALLPLATRKACAGYPWVPEWETWSRLDPTPECGMQLAQPNPAESSEAEQEITHCCSHWDLELFVTQHYCRNICLIHQAREKRKPICMYSSRPLSEGDTFQDAHWMSESLASTTPIDTMCFPIHTYIPVIRLNL